VRAALDLQPSYFFNLAPLELPGEIMNGRSAVQAKTPPERSLPGELNLAVKILSGFDQALGLCFVVPSVSSSHFIFV
jgi:hypothetical protein